MSGIFVRLTKGKMWFTYLNFLSAEDGHSHWEHNRDAEHNGQGVSPDAGEPVSFLVALSKFELKIILFQAINGAVPEGGDPVVCVEGDGGLGDSVRPCPSAGRLRQSL